MNNADFKDTRILEAFDYIDPKYIAEVAESLKLRSVKSNTAAPEMTRRTPFKHWKQFVALAACLILLSAAFPIASYVVEAINSFAAGWGSGTTEELSENSDIEEMPYLQFSPDLEPISQDLVEEINDAFLCLYLNTTLDNLKQEYGEAYKENLKKLRVIRNNDWTSPYYGTFDDCIVFSIISYNYGNAYVNIAGYKFYENTYVYCDKTMYMIKDAYERGLLNDAEIELLAKRHNEFVQFKRENQKMFPQ